MYEEPTKHVVRHAPECTVVASDDLPELYPERRGICKACEYVEDMYMNSLTYMWTHFVSQARDAQVLQP